MPASVQAGLSVTNTKPASSGLCVSHARDRVVATSRRKYSRPRYVIERGLTAQRPKRVGFSFMAQQSHGIAGVSLVMADGDIGVPAGHGENSASDWKFLGNEERNQTLIESARGIGIDANDAISRLH
jgi:hypothetical protein